MASGVVEEVILVARWVMLLTSAEDGLVMGFPGNYIIYTEEYSIHLILDIWIYKIKKR